VRVASEGVDDLVEIPGDDVVSMLVKLCGDVARTMTSTASAPPTTITVDPARSRIEWVAGTDTVAFRLRRRRRISDKAARFRTLQDEGTRLGGMPVFAALVGLGWIRANDAIGPAWPGATAGCPARRPSTRC
jgi:hypothetical protein